MYILICTYMIYLHDIRSQYTFCTQSNTYRLVMKKETYLTSIKMEIFGLGYSYITVPMYN